MRLDFNIARTPTTFYCIFAPAKGTLEDTIAPELMGQVAISFQMKDFFFHRGTSFHVKSILEGGHIACSSRH